MPDAIKPPRTHGNRTFGPYRNAGPQPRLIESQLSGWRMDRRWRVSDHLPARERSWQGTKRPRRLPPRRGLFVPTLDWQSDEKAEQCK